MTQNHKNRATARDAKQARRAKRVVNGVFIGCIILMIVFLIIASELLS